MAVLLFYAPGGWKHTSFCLGLSVEYLSQIADFDFCIIMHGPFSGGLTGKYSFDEVPVIFNRKYFTRLFLYEHKESVIDTQTGEKVAGKYATSKGVKSGDPAQKALKIYGKPKARILDYSKDEEHRIHWV
ncbi:MAG: hypothetical protein KDC70_11815, partial [Saprospiraceae bacterium]|nr:hypothetical protein [Saprospiraceae bacterium]